MKLQCLVWLINFHNYCMQSIEMNGRGQLQLINLQDESFRITGIWESWFSNFIAVVNRNTKNEWNANQETTKNKCHIYLNQVKNNHSNPSPWKSCIVHHVHSLRCCVKSKCDQNQDFPNAPTIKCRFNNRNIGILSCFNI